MAKRRTNPKTTEAPLPPVNTKGADNPITWEPTPLSIRESHALCVAILELAKVTGTKLTAVEGIKARLNG